MEMRKIEDSTIIIIAILNRKKNLRKIELRISKFEGNRKTTFVVPVNDERVLIEYTASNGKHMVNISKTNIASKIEAVGSDDKTIEVNY